MLKRFIKSFFKCHHKNACIHNNEGFCPDCGKYLKKTYYVVRCANCGIKRSAKKSFNEIIPTEKFCINCGEKEFAIEKYDRLNFVDVNYAIQIKEVVEENEAINELEIWVEGCESRSKKESPPLLIGEVKYLSAN